ncbi:hypothetical protein L2E82_11702 [Cichorium intybus]|uniref:Uncharacterized protein n=1 Tax=Cichorium intybus TaxID=13427 RepID=A0ACB9GF21_CICIN|nr:hypothetical protein L2E82_11702 [Cichorium intybus]
MVSTLFIAVTIFFVHISSCLCVVRHSNSTFPNKMFSPALATWYGDETGAGSGGACGWGDDVKDPPLSSMIAAGNANIFLSGKGCGHCFQILCHQPPYCSGKPITVTISDECPGACNNVGFHFDLSGFAFGAMANPGQDHNLRQLGQVTVLYRRVPCSYRTTKIAFVVNNKCNSYWFAVAIEYADGDGGFGSVEIAPSGTKRFVSMENIWGAVWKIDIDPSFQAPFSFRMTSDNGRTLVANNVIPENFVAGHKYLSQVNF